MAHVRIENVHKIYPPDTVAVQNANIEALDKEFLALVGTLRVREIDAAAHDRRAGKRHGGATSISMSGASRMFSRKTATSPWCFKTTPFIRI